MKFIWFDVQRINLCIGHRHSGRVVAPVEFYADFQSGLSRGFCYQVDDDVMTDQGLSVPVLSDVTKQSIFYLVSLAGPRREVTHAYGHSD